MQILLHYYIIINSFINNFDNSQLKAIETALILVLNSILKPRQRSFFVI